MKPLRLAALLALLSLAGTAWWAHRQAGPAELRYTVVRGDTLSKIARRYGVTVEELRAWNGIQGDLIEVGQVLVIRGGSAQAAPGRASPRRRQAASPAGSAGAEPPLSLPPERPCLPPPSAESLEGGDEPAYLASRGLSREQVSRAMRAFFPRLVPCVQGDWPRGTLTVELVVACTGRVSAVRLEDDGGLDPALVSCVLERLRYVPFPAHDLPGGFTFTFPLRFEPPAEGSEEAP